MGESVYLCFPNSFLITSFRRQVNSLHIIALMITTVSQLSKCLKLMTFLEECFVIHVEDKYLSEALETFYRHQFYKR